MSSAARRLIDDALQLSAEERADIVDELIASMGAQPLDAEWTAEIERRAARALAEPDGGTPWAEAVQVLSERQLQHSDRQDGRVQAVRGGAEGAD